MKPHEPDFPGSVQINLELRVSMLRDIYFYYGLLFVMILNHATGLANDGLNLIEEHQSQLLDPYDLVLTSFTSYLEGETAQILPQATEDDEIPQQRLQMEQPSHFFVDKKTYQVLDREGATIFTFDADHLGPVSLIVNQALMEQKMLFFQQNRGFHFGKESSLPVKRILKVDQISVDHLVEDSGEKMRDALMDAIVRRECINFYFPTHNSFVQEVGEASINDTENSIDIKDYRPLIRVDTKKKQKKNMSFFGRLFKSHKKDKKHGTSEEFPNLSALINNN